MSWKHAEVERCLIWQHPASGLRAAAVIDDLTGGLAAGGIRTRAFAGIDEAIEEAAQLARAMTLKCALADLAVGGCKIAVIDHPGLRRREAFAQLGRYLAELSGIIRTAGDLGTSEADLQAVATTAPAYVHLDEGRLAASVARGVLSCVRAWLRHRGEDDALGGKRMAVQGCGSIGSAVAEALAQAGAQLLVSDIDASRAERLQRLLGAEVLAPESCLRAEVDVLLPCAMGGVIDTEVASALRARAVIGAANNVLSDDAVALKLAARGIDFVPDVIASAGAVIDGISRSVMGVEDPSPRIDALGDTAAEVLRRSKEHGVSTPRAAQQLAAERRAAPKLTVEAARATLRSPR